MYMKGEETERGGGKRDCIQRVRERRMNEMERCI